MSNRKGEVPYFIMKDGKLIENPNMIEEFDWETEKELFIYDLLSSILTNCPSSHYILECLIHDLSLDDYSELLPVNYKKTELKGFLNMIISKFNEEIGKEEDIDDEIILDRSRIYKNEDIERIKTIYSLYKYLTILQFPENHIVKINEVELHLGIEDKKLRSEFTNRTIWGMKLIILLGEIDDDSKENIISDLKTYLKWYYS